MIKILYVGSVYVLYYGVSLLALLALDYGWIILPGENLPSSRIFESYMAIVFQSIFAIISSAVGASILLSVQWLWPKAATHIIIVAIIFIFPMPLMTAVLGLDGFWLPRLAYIAVFSLLFAFAHHYLCLPILKLNFDERIPADDILDQP